MLLLIAFSRRVSTLFRHYFAAPSRDSDTIRCALPIEIEIKTKEAREGGRDERSFTRSLSLARSSRQATNERTNASKRASLSFTLNLFWKKNSFTRLLATWTAAAKRHGVPNRGVVAWVRRKLGPDVTVLRVRTDGSLGCATPCVLCRRALIAFDLRVSCPPGASGGGWYCGRLCSPDAPAPTLTSGQRRLLGHPSPPKEGSRRSAARRKDKENKENRNRNLSQSRHQHQNQNRNPNHQQQNFRKNVFDHYTSNDGTSFRDCSNDGSDFWRVNGGTGGRTGAAAAAAQNAARRRRRGVSIGDVSRGFAAVSGASSSSSSFPASSSSWRHGHRVPGPAQPAARTWFEDSSASFEEKSNGGGGSSSDGGGGGGSGGNGGNKTQSRRSRRRHHH